MNEILKLGLILFIITAVSASVLAVSNNITEPRIAEADRKANDLAKQEVLETAEEFDILDEGKLKEVAGSNSNIIEINEGYSKEGEIVGYTFKTKVKGYGGEMELIIGISTEGEVTGINILNHGETPGLGANATESYFTDSFKNKLVDNELVAVKDPSEDNEVQALTSATITTTAVVDGVNIVREIYNSKLAN
ncbi:MAG: RnfABCDGE type electron transport complex subunit G [Tissierellia bacterium]|nr:RnfABCDGE type electron transport complex subunit G [Tissierellia bacterium]